MEEEEIVSVYSSSEEDNINASPSINMCSISYLLETIAQEVERNRDVNQKSVSSSEPASPLTVRIDRSLEEIKQNEDHISISSESSSPLTVPIGSFHEEMKQNEDHISILSESSSPVGSSSTEAINSVSMNVSCDNEKILEEMLNVDIDYVLNAVADNVLGETNTTSLRVKEVLDDMYNDHLDNVFNAVADNFVAVNKDMKQSSHIEKNYTEKAAEPQEFKTSTQKKSIPMIEKLFKESFSITGRYSDPEKNKYSQTRSYTETSTTIIDDDGEEFPIITLFPTFTNRDQYIINLVNRRLPTFYIVDVIMAVKYKENDEIVSDHLHISEDIVFNFISIRGTITGVKKGIRHRYLVDDGTGAIFCFLDEEKIINAGVFPIIEEFDSSAMTYQAVTAHSHIKLGDKIQAKGKLSIYNNKQYFFIEKICKEIGISIYRESMFIDYMERLYKQYSDSNKWKKFP